MRIKSAVPVRIALLLVVIAGAALLSSRLRADTGTCGGASITLPFTDVLSTNVFFCSIAEAYLSGLTNGTTPTTYNPADPVPREQMAAFVTRTMDQSLKRGSRRAALNQNWTPANIDGLGFTTVGASPQLVESDGADVWVAGGAAGTVSRVRASDGKQIGTWTGASNATGVLAAKGLIFVTGRSSPGVLYQIDPSQPVAAVTTLASTLGDNPVGIAFDGARIWTANASGSVSIVTLNPVSVTTVTSGFTSPLGILYDGANVWVTNDATTPGTLLKLDSNGAIIQTVNVGLAPQFPVFDGTNIWVPNCGGTVTVVRAATGVVLATLSGNGLNCPFSAAFDGERVLITDRGIGRVYLWKAADLSPLGFVSLVDMFSPNGACSDGLNFWIALDGAGAGFLVRF